jgi:hypothetical protein
VSRVPAPEGHAGLWLGLAFAVVALGIGGFVARRRHSQHRCPSCGFDLAGALAQCTYCSAEHNVRIAEAAGSGASSSEPSGNGHRPARAAEGDRTMPPLPAGEKKDTSVLSETAMERMNMTEEFLEKTVTLRERPVLVVTGGPGSGRVFSLSHDTTTCLGRAKMNDIILDDTSVSSEHCRIRPEEGGFIVHDLKSTNGTYVNEKKVSHHPLAAGDVLKIGETSLQYRLDHQRAS